MFASPMRGGDIDDAAGRASAEARELVSVAHLQRQLRDARERKSAGTRRAATHVQAGGHSMPATAPERHGAESSAGDDSGDGFIVVRSAHPGAGSSTVSLAIADALAERGHRVRLVELADPVRSGMAGASTVEFGTDDSGWQRGRRGALVEISRRTDAATRPDVTPLLAKPATSSGRLVLDVGWRCAGNVDTDRHLQASRGPQVVVCRMSVPGLRQAELLLGALAGPVLVAVVGPNRWPPIVVASCGPRLRQLRRADHVVSVPVIPRLAIAGLTGDPMPRPVLAAGRLLLVRLSQLPAALQPAACTEGEITHVG